MSKDANGYVSPNYASEVPCVPVDWQDRDNITGRLMEILEAVMPEGRQLEATKNLVKESTKQYWITLFNDQYDLLGRAYDENMEFTVGGIGHSKYRASHSIWQDTLAHYPTEDPAKD